MARYVAFLRGINLGGHRLKMDALRAHFETLGFANVATFIASGNVIFDSPTTDPAALETKIERHLARALGYEAATFLRTLPEIAELCRFPGFADRDLANPDYSRYVYLLREPATAKVKAGLATLRSALDEFHTEGRAIYWLCRGKISQPGTAWQAFDKLLARERVDCTARNVKTLQRILTEYSTADDSAETAKARPRAASKTKTVSAGRPPSRSSKRKRTREPSRNRRGAG